MQTITNIIVSCFHRINAVGFAKMECYIIHTSIIYCLIKTRKTYLKSIKNISLGDSFAS